MLNELIVQNSKWICKVCNIRCEICNYNDPDAVMGETRCQYFVSKRANFQKKTRLKPL
jgi:hypothetical protein